MKKAWSQAVALLLVVAGCQEREDKLDATIQMLQASGASQEVKVFSLRETTGGTTQSYDFRMVAGGHEYDVDISAQDTGDVLVRASGANDKYTIQVLSGSARGAIIQH